MHYYINMSKLLNQTDHIILELILVLATIKLPRRKEKLKCCMAFQFVATSSTITGRPVKANRRRNWSVDKFETRSTFHQNNVIVIIILVCKQYFLQNEDIYVRLLHINAYIQ